MKIAIIRHSIKNRGSDKALFQYADYLIKQGHHLIYYTNAIKTDLAFNSKIQFKQIPLPGKGGTILFTLFTKFKEDIVCYDLIATSCLAWLRNKKKLVYLARGYDVSYYSSALMRFFIKACYKLALNILKITVITVSDALTAELLNFYPYKIMIVNNGVDLEKFKKNPSDNNKNETPVILIYARHEYVKGLDISLKTLENTAQSENFIVWVVGDEIHPLPKFKTVNYGFVNESRLNQLFSSADIFLLPSRSEGLSPMLLQALACECAIVATEAANIITHQENGLISPVDDISSLSSNLKKVLKDKTLQEKLKTNARKLAEQYSLNKSCEKFQKVLTEIFNIL